MALGIIEVYGFTAAIAVSDIAAKSANIKILSIDKNKPSKNVNIPLIMAINITGKISDVEYAIDIGVNLAKKMKSFVISHIINNESYSTVFLASRNVIGYSKLNIKKGD